MACHTRDTVDFHRTAGTERVRQRRLDVARAQAANEEKPSYYLAWIQVESADVAEQYARLIAEARRVAGRAMHNGWNDPSRAIDPEMNIPREVIDLGDSRPLRPSACKPCGNTCPA